LSLNHIITIFLAQHSVRLLCYNPRQVNCTYSSLQAYLHCRASKCSRREFWSSHSVCIRC